MFRRLRSTERTAKSKEPKAAQETAPARIDPALTMGLDEERDSQFSYPTPHDARLDGLRETADDWDDNVGEAVEMAATEAEDPGSNPRRLEDVMPGERRSKLARAAARLPRAVDGVVTVKRGEGRRMVVGRDICLSGEIKSCDSLAVEGRVEADLTGCTNLEVLPTGVVKGNATVQRCEVAGVFEGDLTAEQYLLVRAGGRILGNVNYSEIEVERGGHISGQMIEIVAAESETAAVPADHSADAFESGDHAAADDADDRGDYEKELEEERARLKALQASA